MTLTGLPLEFDGERPPYRFSAPKLGEHNDRFSSPIRPAQESRLMKDLKYQTLALEQPSEHLLVVRFNRPEVRNAISTQVGLDMLDLFSRFSGAARLSLRGADRHRRQGVLRRRRPERAPRHDRRRNGSRSTRSSSA